MTKTEWENRFQSWSDKMSQDGTTPLGKCGYGCMCDNCDGDFKNNACVKALNDLLQEHNMSLDYNDERNLNFKNVFNGNMYINE